MIDLTKSQYPYMPLTFSIWRREKYEDLKSQTTPSLMKLLTIKFHEEVDKKLLYSFAAKVKEGIKDSFKALRTPCANKLQ